VTSVAPAQEITAVRSGPASLRRIAALALPALVVLAAEPVYLLVDTAVIGRLGGSALAALAAGGAILSVAVWLGNIVAYGTTGRAARSFGGGDRPAAVAEGVQATWLAGIVGVLLLAVLQIFAEPLTRAVAGGSGDIADAAAGWLRVAAWGVPGLMLATAGNGWLRGVQDTRRPLRIVLGANLLSAILCPLLVHPMGWGLTGSAVANVIAQSVGGALFLLALLSERVSLRPRPRVIGSHAVLGRDLLLRGAAMQASFLSAAAVAARFGADSLAAHQIALQLWMFTALALDAVAIAGQSLVGAAVGARDPSLARQLGRRLAVVGGIAGVGFGLLIAVGAGALPLFTTDPAVREQALIAWPWFVAMQPLAGVVFALDGVLIGAGDVRYLRNLTIVATLGGFLPAVWLAYLFDLGLGGVWAGLTLFIVLRLIALLLRLRSGRWASIATSAPVG
jgi:putative MATE family efflux protein